jgi:hypothetical protein
LNTRGRVEEDDRTESGYVDISEDSIDLHGAFRDRMRQSFAGGDDGQVGAGAFEATDATRQLGFLFPTRFFTNIRMGDRLPDPQHGGFVRQIRSARIFTLLREAGL